MLALRYNPTKFGNEIALNSAKALRGKGELCITADAKERTAQSIPATLHRLKTFFSAFGPEKRKG